MELEHKSFLIGVQEGLIHQAKYLDSSLENTNILLWEEMMGKQKDFLCNLF